MADKILKVGTVVVYKSDEVSKFVGVIVAQVPPDGHRVVWASKGKIAYTGHSILNYSFNLIPIGSLDLTTGKLDALI